MITVTPEQARCIIDGTLTEWREPMDPQPLWGFGLEDCCSGRAEFWNTVPHLRTGTYTFYDCPYGKPGCELGFAVAKVVDFAGLPQLHVARIKELDHTLTDVQVVQEDDVWKWVLRWGADENG